MDVTDTVVNTLRSAIDRRVRHLARNTALSLRTVAWPLLVLLCIYGVDQVAFYIQQYLHGSKSASDALFQVGPALLWGIGAALALVASAALLVFRWRVADNSMRFLGLIGFVLLLTFWIFSLALAGLNLLLLPQSVECDGSRAILSTWLEHSALAGGAGDLWRCRPRSPWTRQPTIIRPTARRRAHPGSRRR